MFFFSKIKKTEGTRLIMGSTKKKKKNWKLFYHFKLDTECLKLYSKEYICTCIGNLLTIF